MWSPYHDFYLLRNDADYSTSVPSATIRTIITTIEGMSATSPLRFSNEASYPPIEILTVNSQNGNYAIKDHTVSFEAINLIEIQSTKQQQHQIWVRHILATISHALNWEIISFQEEDGGEEQLIKL